jgi:thiamine biosynthesis protein ThiS
VLVRYGRKRYEFEKAMTVRKLLKQLDIVPEGVIVAVNGSLVTSDTRVMPDDEVEIIRAISGGEG